MGVWKKVVIVVAAALMSGAPVQGASSIYSALYDVAGIVAEEIEAVADGRAYRCNLCGNVVHAAADEDYTTYKCDDGGAMKPLTMYNYVKNAIDFDFVEDSTGEITGGFVAVASGIGTGQLASIGYGFAVFVEIEDGVSGVCAKLWNYSGCRVITDKARQEVNNAAMEVSADIHARFDALKGGAK